MGTIASVVGRRNLGCLSSVGPECGLHSATGCRLTGSGSGSSCCLSTRSILTCGAGVVLGAETPVVGFGEPLLIGLRTNCGLPFSH